MKRKFSSLFLLLAIAALILAGCNLPFSGAIPVTAPQVTITLIHLPTSTSAPPVTATAPAASSTPTPQPNATSTSTATATTAPPTQPPNASACDSAAFLGDVTIPDRSLMAQGTSFVKTWRVQNTGSCTWTTAYQLVFVSGYNMSGPRALHFSAPVAPGSSVDLSVNLIVPPGYGTYSANSKLEDDKGNVFGVGPSGSDSLVVRILTPFTPTPTPFAVPSVTVTVDASSATTSCPPGHTFNFTATITTNNSGVVTYHWIFSNGTATGDQSLTFSSASSQSVTAGWSLGSNGHLADGNPYNGWAEIYINAPNHQTFSPTSIQLNCSP